MINKVILIGNLGKDPEIRHLESGVSVATFSVATNESYLDKSNQWQTITEWHNVVAWRKLSEYVERNFKKGKQVFIEGKLTNRKYQAKDGTDRYITEVVARTLRVLGPRDEASGGYTSPATPEAESTVKAVKEGTKDMPMPDDDLPF